MCFNLRLITVSSNRRQSVRRSPRRRGTAIVELAACLPMLALLVLGSIQACDLIYLKHSIVSAAYEGTIELIRPNSTNASVIARVEQVLAMQAVEDFNIEILPAGIDVSTLPTGTPVEIRVLADIDSNLAVDGWFPVASQVEHTAVGPR
jgi:Flp pilus assembly protein TadG